MKFSSRSALLRLPASAPRSKPRLETLDDRAVPATLVGLTTTGTLVTFDSSTPGTVSAPVTVSGLQTGETLVGIDYRPANGQLVGVGSSSRLYLINPSTGAATAIGSAPFTPALSGTNFAVDFNPAADKLRVESNTGQNLRINADTGVTAATDTALSYDPQSYNDFQGTTGPPPRPRTSCRRRTPRTPTSSPTPRSRRCTSLTRTPTYSPRKGLRTATRRSPTLAEQRRPVPRRCPRLRRRRDHRLRHRDGDRRRLCRHRQQAVHDQPDDRGRHVRRCHRRRADARRRDGRPAGHRVRHDRLLGRDGRVHRRPRAARP